MTLTRRRGVAAVGALLLAATLSVSACQKKEETTTETDEGVSVALVSPGVLKTCTSLPYPPFQEEVGGEVVGFDVDVVDLIAKKLNVTQEIVDIEFSQIESGAAMVSGKCDLAAAGMTITDERKQNVTFSDPYFDESIAFMTATDKTVTTIDDIKNGDLKLGVQANTTSLSYAEENGLEPREFDDAGAQLDALKSGVVDVILQDLPVINDWLKESDISASYHLGGTILTGAQYGFALKKDADPAFVTLINEVLATARSDGSYDAIYSEWIGTPPADGGNPAPSGS